MIIYLAAIDAPEDRDTFVALYETYRNLMFHVAHKILRNEADAEDAVHDAFVTVAEKFKFFFPGASQNPVLLVTIVEHKAIDLYRKKQRRERPPGGGDLRHRPRAPGGRLPLAQCILRLPGRYREFFRLEVRAGLLHPGGKPADGPVLGRRPKAGAAGQGKTAGALPGGGIL